MQKAVNDRAAEYVRTLPAEEFMECLEFMEKMEEFNKRYRALWAQYETICKTPMRNEEREQYLKNIAYQYDYCQPARVKCKRQY